jgi:glycosyltransferase involved in cell wall biosynthesis
MNDFLISSTSAPYISVITVSYNSGKTIRDTLNSIDEQTFKNFEHIIIDGCSTDNTLKIIDEYNCLNRLVHSNPDDGLYDAMNKGFRLAKGKIIGFLNSDDVYYDRNVLQKIVKIFCAKENLQLLYGDLEYTDEFDLNKVRRKWISGKVKKNAFKNSWAPPHPTFYIKRDLQKAVGFFNIQLSLAADFDFMFRCFNQKDVLYYYLPETIVKMRSGGVTNNSIKNIVIQNSQILDSLGAKGNPFFVSRFFIKKIFNRIIQYWILK